MSKTHRRQAYQKERKPVPPTGGVMADKRTKRQGRHTWREEWEQEQADTYAEAQALAEHMEDMI